MCRQTIFLYGPKWPCHPLPPLPIFLPYVTSPLSPVQLAGEPDHENTSSGLRHVGLTGELGGWRSRQARTPTTSDICTMVLNLDTEALASLRRGGVLVDNTRSSPSLVCEIVVATSMTHCYVIDAPVFGVMMSAPKTTRWPSSLEATRAWSLS